MKTQIRLLNPESPGFPEPFYSGYVTSEHYAVTVETSAEGARFTLRREPLPFPIEKGFVIELNPPYFRPAEDYGLYLGEELIGLLELYREDWTNRLRITELWIKETCRRKGYAGELLRFAIRRGRERECRAMVLETQSCNAGAIACYRKNGFSFIGLDAIHYADDDVARGEVRLEMGLLLREGNHAE